MRVFHEKPENEEQPVNGGFFVFKKAIADYLDGDACVLERKPLEKLAAANQLRAYNHPGFWQCMDTLRDKQNLNALWDSGAAPWKLWD